MVTKRVRLGETASFDGLPKLASAGPTAVGAVRRLLEGAEASHGMYYIERNSDPSCTKSVPGLVVWDPLEMLVTRVCCEGRGTYAGLHDVETCRTCWGRTVVPA
jgi:hypothetical protein